MNTQNTPNPRCSKCQCYWKPDEHDIKTSGLPFRTCKKCRARKQYDKCNEKLECECGRSYIRKHKAQHNRSKLHQEFAEKQEY